MDKIVISMNDLPANWLKETRKLKQKVLADRIRETVRERARAKRMKRSAKPK